MARGTSPRPMLRPEGFAVKPTRGSSPRPKLRPSDPETTAVMSPETYGAVSDQTEAAFGPAPVSSLEEVEEIRNTPPGFEQKASLSEIVGDAIDPSSDEKVKKLEDYLAGVGPVQRDPFDEVVSRGWIKAIKNSPYGDKYKSNLNLLSQDGIDTVKGMFKNSLGADPKWDPLKENWCATFVNTVLMGLGADLLQTGDKYDRLRARKYVKYGSPVSRDNLQQGDIVVLDFPRNADGDIDFRDPTAKRDGVGDHVTFYAGDNSGANRPGTGFIGVLGGNQGYDSEIGLTEYSEANILATRRITYNDIDYEFTKELAKENPDFNSFLKEQGEGFDMEAFSNPDPLGFDEGGLAESKGLSWGELIVDNILGLDNEYESFGEKLGKAINEDEIKFLKDAAIGVYEGTKEFVQAPVETTKQVVSEIKDSVTRLGSEDLNTRLQRMYGVSYEQATDEQVNQAREAVLGDALTALELLPAAKGATTVAKAGIAAVPGGLKADVIGQTKAMLSGDREFLSGTPSNRASTQSLSAGFTGQNPPTYQKRDTPLSQQEDFELDFNEDGVIKPKGIPSEKTELSRKDFVVFRDPIRELAETVTIPKKGLLGSEFLKMIKKNESVADSSLQPQIIDPKRRYTREELLEAIGDDEGYPGPNVFRSETYIGERQGSFRNYQRQGKDAGFLGIGKELDYFELPVMSRPPSGSEGTGKPFKANSQHFDEDTIVHARGSIVQPADGVPVSFEYEDLIGQKPFLLVEEIQSDLLQKGYVKPGKLSDMAFKKVTEEWSRNNYVSFQEAFGEVSKDIKNIFEELDEANMVRPDLVDGFSARDKFYRNAANRGFVYLNELEETLDKLNVNPNEIGQYTGNLLDRGGGFYRIMDADTGQEISVKDFLERFQKETYVSPREKTQKFFDKSRELLAKRQIDKEIKFDEFQDLYERYKINQHRLKQGGYHQDVGLPPITKNKQAVEESLKALIAKAAREGVDKIVIPPADRIARARERTLDFSDKGDRFYRTYVTDLNKALNDLEKNYPVEVRRNVEMPYDNRLSGPRKLEAIEQGLQTLSLRGELETFTVSSPSIEVSIPEDMNYEVLRQAMDREVHAENLTAEQEKVFRAFAVHNRVSFEEAPEVFSQWHVKQTDELFKKPWFQAMLPESDTAYGTILDISELVDQFKVEEPRQFAEGGAVGNMNQQMSFAFEDGGLRDDGMMRDPVSGNEIPPGSTAKEVRDDIPAQLSEGEYVVPADVVRYYGVKFFEDLRDEAKRGLQDMEANGRIGGEPVPAGGPMADDLSPEEMAAIQEMMGMAEGGVVNMYKQQQDLYTAPNPAIGNSNTNYAYGGVVGYAPGGLQAATEQDIYTAGQQAQQAGFVGFPLGSTIYPTEAQLAAGQTTPSVDPTAPQRNFPIEMYNAETETTVMATSEDQYQQLLSQGYVEATAATMPALSGVQAPSVSGDDDGPPTTPPGESKPAYGDWLNSADFNSEAGIEEFIAGISYDPSKSNLDMQTLGATVLAGPMAGLATAAGGALRGGGLQAISDLRAASLIAKAQGLDELASKIDTQVADIIKDGPDILDFLDDIFASGKQKANAWAKKNGHENIQAATEAGVTPKPPATPPAQPGSGDDDKPVFAGAGRQEGFDAGTVGNLSGTTTAEKTAAVTEATAGVEKGPAASAGATTASTEGGGTTAGGANLDTSMGITGLDKGGLMATPKKKKAKRQFRKGGLANKK